MELWRNDGYKAPTLLEIAVSMSDPLGTSDAGDSRVHVWDTPRDVSIKLYSVQFDSPVWGFLHFLREHNDYIKKYVTYHV